MSGKKELLQSTRNDEAAYLAAFTSGGKSMDNKCSRSQDAGKSGGSWYSVLSLLLKRLLWYHDLYNKKIMLFININMSIIFLNNAKNLLHTIAVLCLIQFIAEKRAIII